MEDILLWVLDIFSLLVTTTMVLALPVVAYPFAAIARHGRQALDDMINWHGPNAERNERYEDRVTTTVAILVVLAFIALVTGLYLWWIDGFVLESNQLLSEALKFSDDSPDGSLDAFAIYCIIVSLVAALMGWRR